MAIEEIDDFKEWFKKVGGNMISVNFGLVLEPNKKIEKSSLKSNPERIKFLYNHKFKYQLN